MTYGSDVEHATESTSMLRRNSQDHDKKKPGKFWLWRLLDLFTGGIYAPNASTYAPIEIILNTEDEVEQDKLTERWRDNRLSELSFVGVVVSISLKHTFEGPRDILVHLFFGIEYTTNSS